MEKRQIRISKGIEIEVNDNGDCIYLQVDDVSFYKKFEGLTERLDEISNEGYAPESIEEKIEYYETKLRSIITEIDNVFGENTCKKVFGDIVPGPYLITSFFDQLIPIITECAKERHIEINKKYNRNRKKTAK